MYNPGYQKSNTPLWYVNPVLQSACMYKDWRFTGSLWNPRVTGGSGRVFFKSPPPNPAILGKYSEPGVMIQIKEPAHTAIYIITNCWIIFFNTLEGHPSQYYSDQSGLNLWALGNPIFLLFNFLM